MKSVLVAAATVVAMTATSVLAQTTTTQPAGTEKSMADCQAQWRTADKNSDGRLDTTEISDAKSVVPTSLGSKTSLTQQEFMSACTARVQGDKK